MQKYETPPPSVRGPLSISTGSSSSQCSTASFVGRRRANTRDGAFPISPRSSISSNSTKRRLSPPITSIPRPPTPPMSPSAYGGGVAPAYTPSSPTPIFSPTVPFHRDMFSPSSTRAERQRKHRRSISLTTDVIRTEIIHQMLPLVETKEDPGELFEREMHAKKLAFHTKEALANIEVRNFKAAEPSIIAVLGLLPKSEPQNNEDPLSSARTVVSEDDDPASSREKWLRHLLDAQSSQNRWGEVIATLQELIVITSAEGGDGAKTAGLHYLLADAYFRSAKLGRRRFRFKKSNLELAESHCRLAMKIAYGIPEMKGAWKDPLKLITKVCKAKGDVAEAKFYRSLLRSDGVDFGAEDDLLDDSTFIKWVGANLSSVQWLTSPFAHMETTDYVLLSIFVGLVGVFGFTVTKCICC